MAARLIRGGCQHDCPDTCAWTVEVQDGRAIGLTGDPAHPLTRGALCGKVSRYLEDRVYGDHRVLHPLKRIGAKDERAFAPVTWEEALADIAARLSSIIARHGSTAIMPFSHQGSMGILQERSLDRRFFHALRSTRLLRDFCGYGAAEGIAAVIGDGAGMLPEQIVHSRYIVLWGTDTVNTNAHLWRLIEQARGDGAIVVTIDPLESVTARHSDVHVRPRPGTDGALALVIARRIYELDLADREFLATRTLGADEFEQNCRSLDPRALLDQTAVPLEVVDDLAIGLATRGPAVIRLMLGLEKHANGAMMARTIACLPAIVGAWNDLGGGLLALTNMLHSEALNLDAVMRPDLEDPSLPSVHWAHLGAALTTADTAAALRGLIVYNANPATTAPDQARVRAGLAREDLFTIVHDTRITDTAAYADYVLPATTMVEHLDLLRSWGQTYVTLNLPAIPPVGEAISVPELFRRLAAAMGMNEPYLYDADETLIRQALDSTSPLLSGITYEALEKRGWMPLNLDHTQAPYTAAPFRTPSGRCELIDHNADASARPRLPVPTLVPDDPEHPLVLLSTKSQRRTFNSTYADDVERRGQLAEPTLDIHPDDAATRKIVTGDIVEVRNRQGRIVVTARVSTYVIPGVVAIPHGRWGSGPHSGSPNLLTRAGLSDSSGGSDYQDTRVEISRLESPTGDHTSLPR